MVKPVLCIVDTGAFCLEQQPIGLQQTIGTTNLSRRSNAVPSSAPPPPPFSKIPALKKLLDPQTAPKLDQFPAADASQSFTSPTVRYNLCRTRAQVELDCEFRRRRRQSWASLSHLGAILPIVDLKWTEGQLVRTGEEHTLPAGEERKLVLVEEGSTCCGRLSPRPARH